ncbi:hypothetical protein HCN44_001909 [Aphidius gifuensis]|uniref:Uncharacterized protein n=1 Tax=Aphidius gifuensis TaxID=684658 RepID=A0A834Y3V0_APHGI|nr:hypothetical protein HCN44_001909 [Aphidius gifuensis]
MAKRAYEEYQYQPAHGVDQGVLNQISHLQNVSIVPVTTATNSTQIAEQDKSDAVSIIPLKNTDKIESKKEESVDAMEIDNSSESSGTIPELTVDPENSDSSDSTLDYMSSTYCKESDKYLTQTDLQEQLLQHGSNLKIIKLGSFFDSRILIDIRNYCQNVEQLELDLVRYTSTHLNQAFVNMKNLKSIVVRNLESELLNEFAGSLPINVEEISMGCQSQEDWKEKALTAFDKFNTVKVLELFFYDLSNEESHTIIKNNQNTIVKLSLRNCKVMNGFDFIFNLKNLVGLDLGSVTSIQYDGSKILRYLANTALNLRYLDMSGYVDITGCALMALSTLENLEVLILNNMQYDIDEFNEAIGLFSHLKKFECRGCYDIVDHGIELLLKKSKNLEYLDVSKTRATGRAVRFANEALKGRTNNTGLTIVIDSSKAHTLLFFKSLPNLKIIKVDHE